MVFIKVVIILCFIAGTYGYSGESKTVHDMAFKQIIELDIKEKHDTEYYGEARISVEVVYGSERSTQRNRFYVFETPFAPISGLSARHNSSNVSKENISVQFTDDQDIFISDEKVHTMQVPSTLKQGDKFSYSYKQTFAELSYLPLYFIPNYDYVEEFTILINHPEELTISFDMFYPEDSLTPVIEHPDDDETTISFKAVLDAKKLSFFPFDTYRAAIRIHAKREDKNVIPANPVEYAGWYSKKTTLEPRLDSSHARIVTDTLGSVQGWYNQLEAIHDYVRSTIRYIADERGMNAIVPRSPSFIIDKRYGDCKDRASLVSAIAQEYGLKVRMALVSTDHVAEFDKPHMGLFNHVICAYQNNDSTIFFDPTSKYMEFGNIPEYLVGAKALILDRTNPRYEIIRRYGTKPNLEIRLEANIDTPHIGIAHITLHNDFATRTRRAIHDLTLERLKQYLQSIVSEYLYQMHVSAFANIQGSTEAVTCTAKIDLSKFILQSGSKVYIPQAAFLPMDNEIMDRVNDSLPIYFGDLLSLKLSILFHTSDFTLQADTFRQGDVDERYFFSTQGEAVTDTARIQYEYRRNLKFLAGKEKNDFLAFHKGYLKHKTNMYIFTRKHE